MAQGIQDVHSRSKLHRGPDLIALTEPLHLNLEGADYLWVELDRDIVDTKSFDLWEGDSSGIKFTSSLHLNCVREL